MSWKPALVGALVVMLAGFGVGFAIDRADGTDPETVVRTVTVAKTVTAVGGPSTVADGVPPTGTTGDATPVPTPPEEPSGRSQYLAELEDDALVGELTLSSPASTTIGHQTFANAVAVDELWDYDCEAPATAEYPITSNTATFVASLGWTQDSGSSSAAIFEVRSDTVDGERLYRRAFEGPGEPVKAVVPLRGAIKMILAWYRADDSCDTLYATFGLGDARLVG
jgi:hypothetical protein